MHTARYASRLRARAAELTAIPRIPRTRRRSRYQMVLLGAQEDFVRDQRRWTREPDTVQEVLRRYVDGGSGAVPRKKPPGGARVVTPEWEAQLAAVVGLSPREAGMESANWTTGLLAEHRWRGGQASLSAWTVRHYLHANGYVSAKRPTWTLAGRRPSSRG